MVLVGYRSNDNRLRIGERVHWIVCHSDFKHLHQNLLPEITNFLGRNNEDMVIVLVLFWYCSGTVLREILVFEVLKLC